MIEQLALLARPVLEYSLVRRTRRNHGLEHATIHVLSNSYRRLRLAGRSTDGGFVLVGEVSTEQVEQAAHEALRRMRGGERHLALHPNCGTNLVAAGALTTLAGLVGLRGKPSLDRITWTMVLMMVALLASQPLGMSLQQHITTSGDPGDLEVVSVTRREMRWPFSGAPVTVHRVVTRRG